jgi:hypothetical protein
MTNPVPKLRYLINLLLTPGMDFKAINLEYDTHAFITKEDIETYIGEKFIEAGHSKIIKRFDENTTIIFHWINNERTGITLKISDTLKMTVSTIHYLLQMEEDLILYKDKT